MVRRRAALRNQHDNDGVLASPTRQDLQRRYNILKAIEQPYFQRDPYKGMDNRGKLDNYHDYPSKNTKKSHNFLNNNNEKSMESYNKIEKIGEKSPQRSRNGIVSTSVKSFELGRAKWRGPLASNYLNKNPNNFKQTKDFSGTSLATNDSNRQEAIKFLGVRQGNVPRKMVATLENVESTSEEKFSGDLSRMSESVHSLNSLNAVIDDLDAQIKALEIDETNKAGAVVEPCKNLYPVIENIKFEPTGWTPQKECNSHKKIFEIEEAVGFTRHAENNCSTDFSSGNMERGRSETFVKSNSTDISSYQETPKKLKRIMPIMESTRKSVHSESTKTKFPTPTRTQSTISTIAMPSTTDSADYEYRNAEETAVAVTDTTTTPFEVEEFLKDALGDELYNTSVTYDISDKDKSNSLFNASELVSEQTTPLQRRVMHAMRPPATDPLPGSSNTLSRSLGLYRTLSQRIKKKFRSALKTKQETPSPPKVTKTDHEADVIGALLQEVSVQQTLMNQASKALNVCHTMKEFVESSERVESDRLLLLASLRRTAALEEIKKISTLERRREKEYLGEMGEITLRDLSLNLRECLRSEPQDGETVEWFVIVVSHGLKVWATRAMSCPINNLRICFPEIISIPNLTPNFKILVQVYSLKLRSSTYQHEEKYRIRRHKRSTSCPPFRTSFLKKSERPLSPKPYRSNPSKSGCTCFILSGFVELFLHDLSLSSPWPLMLVPENSILDRTIELSLACRLHLSVSHEGFLNHGDEAGGLASWNRRWCVLNGHTLMLWNYPRDQETKEPLTVIELINCVSTKITPANRTICAKPRTLLIETVRQRNATDTDSIVFECRSSCTIVRNFLSYDTVHELTEWSTKLNHVVLALREWNVIGSKPPQVSDL